MSARASGWAPWDDEATPMRELVLPARARWCKKCPTRLHSWNKDPLGLCGPCRVSHDNRARARRETERRRIGDDAGPLA